MDHTWIIEKFGGVAGLAAALNHNYPTTVQAWKKRKVIPIRQIPAVLAAAREKRIKLSANDFIAELPSSEQQKGA